MKKVIKRSLKMRRERNKCRVNRLRKQRAQALLMVNPIFILVALTYGFHYLTNAEKVLTRLLHHIFMLTGNPNFPTVTPTLADLQLKADALLVAINAAKNGDRLLIEQRDIIAKEAIEMIRTLGYDIQKQSGGDAEKIHSAGFTTRKPNTPLTAPGMAVIESVKALHEAKVELIWTTLDQAKVMVIEVSQDPNSGIWYFAGLSDTTSIVLNGFKLGAAFHFFQAGSKYYFRVRGWNHVDFGDFSEIGDAFCIE